MAERHAIFKVWRNSKGVWSGQKSSTFFGVNCVNCSYGKANHKYTRR